MIATIKKHGMSKNPYVVQSTDRETHVEPVLDLQTKLCTTGDTVSEW